MNTDPGRKFRKKPVETDREAIYVVTNRRGLALGGHRWHVARHKPTGYGVSTYCGIHFDQGHFRDHGPGVTPLCKTCARLADEREVCQLCERPYVVWCAPSDIWNAVMRGGVRANSDEYGMVCPTCFCLHAETKGITPTAWIVTREDLFAGLEVEHERWREALEDIAENGDHRIDRNLARSVLSGEGNASREDEDSPSARETVG